MSALPQPRRGREGRAAEIRSERDKKGGGEQRDDLLKLEPQTKNQRALLLLRSHRVVPQEGRRQERCGGVRRVEMFLSLAQLPL